MSVETFSNNRRIPLLSTEFGNGHDILEDSVSGGEVISFRNDKTYK